MGTQPASTTEANAADREVCITRVFNAPRELVYKAWTDPTHMAKWWGPRDFTTPVCQMDVRPGGFYRLTMRSPEGDECPLKGYFLEVVEPERLVMTQDCSEHPPEWHDVVNPTRDKSQPPKMDMVLTVTFEDLGGKTRLTMTTRFESVELRDCALNVGMVEGTSQSLDRLEAVVRSLQAT